MPDEIDLVRIAKNSNEGGYALDDIPAFAGGKTTMGEELRKRIVSLKEKAAEATDALDAGIERAGRSMAEYIKAMYEAKAEEPEEPEEPEELEEEQEL